MHLVFSRHRTSHGSALPYPCPTGRFWQRSDGFVAPEGEFRIAAARTADEHRAAAALVRRMYHWRGYHVDQAGPVLDPPDRLTLVAWHEDEAVATLTLRRDTPTGLLCEALYAAEVASLRQEGNLLCEVTRLAVDSDFSSRQLLGALFRTAHHQARERFAATDAVIEVNPRHANFYQREFRFSRLGKLRQCPRVGAPAVLLHRKINTLALPVVPRMPARRQEPDLAVFATAIGA